MHELSIALSILDLVGEESERRASRVRAVHLKLGPLSGVVKSALLSAFDLAREGGPLAATQLLIEETPLVGRCAPCAVDRTLASIQEICCPTCGAPTPDIVSGRELEVVALEIES
jgi:hydrogenase nickel incorporation protein HypA/HybF